MFQLRSLLEIADISAMQAVLLATFVLSFVYIFLKYRGVPPGPWGIPFIGFWPFLKTEKGYLQLQELKEKYGDVFSFTVTGNLFICMNTIKAIKEAHLTNAECFGDRFTGYSLIEETFRDGVAILNGEPWKIQRKFFMQKLREFGMVAVKEDLSRTFYDALKETVEELHATEGQPFLISDLLVVKCSVIVRRILFSNQGITEEELKELNKEYISVLASQTSKNILLMGNFARFCMLPFFPSYWPAIRSHNRIQSMLNGIIMRHKSAFDETQVLDIIDSFYKEKIDREKRGDPTSQHFTDKALLSTVYQFVTDGVLTVSGFIGMFLEFLVQRPEEQDKIYAELMEVVGPSRQPTMEDKGRLPYTNAFIYEAIRYSDFFPMFPSQTCTRETTLRGYRIPKGARTIVNVWAAHHDPNIYEDPDRFDPSRFMTKPGKQRPELPVMFGIGKRSCIGEPYAMIQAFLFVATIVKNFRLTKAVAVNHVSMSHHEGIKICAHPRS